MDECQPDVNVNVCITLKIWSPTSICSGVSIVVYIFLFPQHNFSVTILDGIAGQVFRYQSGPKMCHLISCEGKSV